MLTCDWRLASCQGKVTELHMTKLIKKLFSKSPCRKLSQSLRFELIEQWTQSLMLVVQAADYLGLETLSQGLLHTFTPKSKESGI